MERSSVKNGYVRGKCVRKTSSSIIQFPNMGAGEVQSYCLIGEEGDHGYQCSPYQLSRFRYAILILLYLCTAGILWLVFYWRPDWKLKFTHSPCSFVDKIDSVFLEARDGTDRVYVATVKIGSSEMKEYGPHLFGSKEDSSPPLSPLHENKVVSDSYQNGVTDIIDSSPTMSDASQENDTVIYFIHQYAKFIWDDQQKTFVKVEGLDSNVTFKTIHDASTHGLTAVEQENFQRLYGENVIHVEVPNYFRLLMSEVLNPFYVFQIFACIFWMVDEYYAYATAIIIISTISAIVSLFNVRHERQSLHDMVEHHNIGRVTVVREVVRKEPALNVASNSHTEGLVEDYRTEEIWTKDLVPGDVVVVPAAGMHLSFDAALISGTCIVNESMLTGESVPVTKTPLASSDTEMKKTYSVSSEKSHTLFCGTEVIQTRYYRDELVRVVVVRTGFNTAKGTLVHSILFPKPVDLKLMRDAYRFVGIMFIISLIGFTYSTVLSAMNDESVRDIIFKSIDIITITVPPALPLAMTIGIIYAQVRLKKANIHTVSPQRINICGQIDVVAFDKTGTLTEDGLDLTHIIPAHSEKFCSPMNPSELSILDHKSEIIRCMTTCHCLTLINGEMSGDPLDMKMFEATGWELVEPKVEDESKYDQLQTTYVRPPSKAAEDLSLSCELNFQENKAVTRVSQSEYELGIVRQFPFLSDVKRASVIVKPLKSEPRDMMVYVKGAPETIASLCLSVPIEFTSLLKSYTQQGHRVIALAYKPINIPWLKAQKVERDLIEKDLNFLGFLVLQNKLKSNSSDVLSELDHALIRTVMVTGDNLETAMCVALDCKLLKPDIPVLIAHTNTGGLDGSSSSQSVPTLTWKPAEDLNTTREKIDDPVSPLSSSEDSGKFETIVRMGESCGPYQSQLAMTGKDFAIIKEYYPEFLPAIAVQGTVFARMSPQQKTELMEELESVDYHVLMCGDGANDCGALKRAHVGLSLSEFDASVAAPFTARMENGVESVITLIREGRAALVTSFGMFKFMALYSLIQFTTVLLLYREDSNLSDYEFLYIDLIIIDVVAITMSRNHAHKILHWKKPSSSLVSVDMLVSLFTQIFLQFGTQILAYILVQNQCWYSKSVILEVTSDENVTIANETTVTVPVSTVDYSACPELSDVPHHEFTEDDYPKTYESTSLFLLSSFMYMSVSVAFSRGRPFRTPIYKNFFFVISLLVLIGFSLFLMFGAPPEVEDFFEFRHIPDLDFKLILLGIVGGHFIISLCIELLFIEHPVLLNYLRDACKCCRVGEGKKYKFILNVLNGRIYTEGEYETIPAMVPEAGNETNKIVVDRQIFIPSTVIGQPMEPRRGNSYGTNTNCEHKTRL